MKEYTLKYKNGGSDVMGNVCEVFVTAHETHYFMIDSDASMFRVTVVGADGFVSRHYSTQNLSPHAIIRPLA